MCMPWTRQARRLAVTAAPDAGGLASLVTGLGEFGQPVTAVIESMNGARFIHDQLELRGWTSRSPMRSR